MCWVLCFLHLSVLTLHIPIAVTGAPITNPWLGPVQTSTDSSYAALYCSQWKHVRSIDRLYPEMCHERRYYRWWCNCVTFCVSCGGDRLVKQTGKVMMSFLFVQPTNHTTGDTQSRHQRYIRIWPQIGPMPYFPIWHEEMKLGDTWPWLRLKALHCYVNACI